jgi:hypothetical protein
VPRGQDERQETAEVYAPQRHMSKQLVRGTVPSVKHRFEVTECVYGTKVTGGAVLAAGVVGINVGAATWR